MKDYYKILGVNRDSSDEEIKMAYKRLAMKHHPDRNLNSPESEEKFKEIKEAYEYLSNKKTFFRSPMGNNVNFSDFSNSESSLNDIFDIIFKKDQKKESKLYFLLEVDLELAVYGSDLSVKIPYKGNCDVCLGKGNKPGSDLKICSKCHGAGVHTIMQGIFNFKQKCFKCNAKGYISSENCRKCSGSGKIDKNIICSIKIEKNSDEGSHAKFSELPSADIDFNFNNIIISLKIKNHSFYLRKDFKNKDLYFKYFIDFLKAILGGYLKIITLYGFVLEKITKYTQNEDIKKISGFGLKGKNIEGDLYLTFFIEMISNFSFYQWFLINKLKLSIDLDKNYFLIFEIDKNISEFYKLVFNF